MKLFKAVGDKLGPLELVALLQAIPDYAVSCMTFGDRIKIQKVLVEQAARFKLTPENAPGFFR